ncbi:MAG: UGSC family (seleno)protein, partial [Pseudomonadota bacterium]
MSSFVILEPTASAANEARAAWRPLATLTGKVVGFIDNSKPNFHYLADDLAHLLIERHGVARVVRHRKRSASMPAPETAIADIKAQCDL